MSSDRSRMIWKKYFSTPLPYQTVPISTVGLVEMWSMLLGCIT
ncbi:hypothetical protein CGLO_12480 [Colletotrichum gloeosporioides Cg-14]|uniref:Uncharacterized protein n=1 Tax=Colletotrichum gloeosporioides (strain Cg-14) TaxID=1237896 RepID=T0K8E0_COLGC|nr:hypothetical protein CGLO_12480 [Colletotrichum gloeosporioides Cg-14]